MKKLLMTALFLMSHNAIAGDNCNPSFIQLTSNGKALMTKVSNINSFDRLSDRNTPIFYHDSKVVVEESSEVILDLIMGAGKVKCDTNQIPQFISLGIPGGTDQQVYNVYDIEYYFPVTSDDNYYTIIHFKGGWNSSVEVANSYKEITKLIYPEKPDCRTWVVCSEPDCRGLYRCSEPICKVEILCSKPICKVEIYCSEPDCRTWVYC